MQFLKFSRSVHNLQSSEMILYFLLAHAVSSSGNNKAFNRLFVMWANVSKALSSPQKFKHHA